MQKAQHRLVKGTVLYMLANMTSKVLQMMLLPVITSVLLTEQYGYYDLIVTTIGLMAPVVTMQITESMFRYLFDASGVEKRRIISTVTAFITLGFIILGVGIGIVKIAIPALQYPWLIYLNYITYILFNYMQKLARCENLNRQFAISGVINTATMLSFQAITLLLFNMRADGMLLANAMSYFAAALYIEQYVHVEKSISKEFIDKNTLSSLLKYSIPLVPNSLAWWIVASSDRYVISFMIGVAANGIYSIAGKFSQLLTFATGVFQLAWQESAILERNSKDKDSFYTQTFNSYMRLLLSSYSVILPLIRMLFPLLISNDYQQGYLYNPILLMGSIFSSFSQYYGSAYLVFNKTTGAFQTTLLAAIINVTIGFSLVSQIGLFAPALGTLVSFFVQWIVRAIQMREYFHVKPEWGVFVVLVIFDLLITVAYYMNYSTVHVTSIILGIIIFAVTNRKLLFQGWVLLRKKLGRK